MGAVFGDNRVGGIENDLGGAIILFEVDNGGILEIGGKRDQIAIIGAAPAINSLRGIADSGDLTALEARSLVIKYWI